MNNNSIPAPQDSMEGISAFDDAFFPPSNSPPPSDPPFPTLLPHPKPSHPSTSQGRYSIKASVCQHLLRYSDTLPWSGTELDFEERYCEGCLRRDRFAKDIAAVLERDELPGLDTLGDQGPFMGYPTVFGDRGEGESGEPSMGWDCVVGDLFGGKYLLRDDEEGMIDPAPLSPEFGVSFSPQTLWDELDHHVLF